MANGKSSAVKDAAITAAAAVAIVVLVSVLITHGFYGVAGLVLVGVFVFAVALYFHSSRFYRRMAGACLGLLAGVLSIPAIKFSAVLGQIAAFDFVMDSIGTCGVLGISMTFCVALCVCAWMDRIQQQPGRATDVSLGEGNLNVTVQSQTSGQQICAPDKSPTIGYAEAVHITYAAPAEMTVSAEQGTLPVKNKQTCTWPGISLPHGGPKISEPFAGRADELKELAAAMASPKKIAAVIGMAGQGKSCLIGEWYKRGARPPEGIGLFWRKVYESGYTFDRFLDDLHLYLTGEPTDRMQLRTVRDRTTVVEGLLDAKPCWIVLYGMERWLRRWADDPDADAKNPSPDDRAGCESEFDKFLTGACSRENGSRLLLTTRAVPSALDGNRPVMIGSKHGVEKRLSDLKAEEAIRLLDDLDVKGPENVKREAVTAYGCHAYAVHVLGRLLCRRYGGDVSRWRDVNPLKDHKLDGLFERIVETYTNDLPLLELVACSLGPAPVEMLGELTARDETVVRELLAALKDWEMVEFEGTKAEQHTIVRQFLLARMDRQGTQARRKQIAAWWAHQMVPVNAKTIQDIVSLLYAIEHLVAARDIRVATSIFFTQPPASHYNIDDWLRAFGYLDDGIRIATSMIETIVHLIKNEGHDELYDDLASCHNSRGNARRALGLLSEATADYDQAVEITIRLVEEEGRRELRAELARQYSNRGVVLGSQGFHSRSIADYGHAIEIATILVEREGDNQLRSDLAGFYCNRGITWAAQGRLVDAIADYGQAIQIVKNLVKREGRLDLRKDLAVFYNNRGLALAAQGRLSEAIADYGSAVEITEELIEGDGRSEYRDLLATCQNNRGLALAHQGHLHEAIADHTRAINIYEMLVQREGRRELRDGLAAFHSSRGIALATQGRLQEAIADHSLAVQIREELVEREGQSHLRCVLAVSYNNRGAALATQGRLNEAANDYGRAIKIREELVIREGRRDQRDDLAISCIGRGLVLRQQKHLTAALADCRHAIEIETTLVEQEGRYELRENLAKAYVGCGLIWADQKRLREAVAGYDRAIDIYEALVDNELRHDLRYDLASSLLNRAVAQSGIGEWQRADVDIKRGTVLLRQIIEQGQRHVLPALFRAADLRCRYAKELGDPVGEVQAANEAMGWLVEEVEQNRVTEPLLKVAAGFAECVRGKRRFLLRYGLDEDLWKRFQTTLGPTP